MLCYVMLCYGMYAMLCYAMLSYVMLCYVPLCYVRLCYVLNQFLDLKKMTICFENLKAQNTFPFFILNQITIIL